MNKKHNRIKSVLAKFDYFKLKTLANELNISSHNLNTAELRDNILNEIDTDELYNHLKLGFRWKSWYNALLAILLFAIPYLTLSLNKESIPKFNNKSKFNIVVTGFQNLSSPESNSNSQLIYERLNFIIKKDSMNCEIMYEANFPSIVNKSEQELDIILQKHNINLLIFGYVDETCNTKEICINWHSNSNLDLDKLKKRNSLESKFHTYTNDALLNGSLQEELEYIIYFFSALIANKSYNHDKVIKYVQEDIIDRLGISTCMSSLLLADSYLEKSQYDKSIEILQTCDTLCNEFKDRDLARVKAKIYSELELYHLFGYHNISDLEHYYDKTENFANTCEIFYNLLFINQKLELHHKNKIQLDSFVNSFKNEISESHEYEIYLNRLKFVNSAYIGHPIYALDGLRKLYIDRNTPYITKQLIIDDYNIICDVYGLEKYLKSFLDKEVPISRYRNEGVGDNFHFQHDIAIEMLIEFIHNPKNEYNFIIDRYNEIKPILFKGKYKKITQSRIEYLIGSFTVPKDDQKKVELHYKNAIQLLNNFENSEIIQSTIYVSLVNSILANSTTLRNFQTGGVIYLNENNLDQFPSLFEDFSQDSTIIFNYYTIVDSLLADLEIKNTYLEIKYNDSKAYAYSSFNNYSKANEYFVNNHDLLHESELFQTILHSQNAYNMGSHLLTYNTEQGIKRIETAYKDRMQIVPNNSPRLIAPLTRLIEGYQILNDSAKVEELSLTLMNLISKTEDNKR